MKAQAGDHGPASRHGVVWSAHSSSSVHFNENRHTGMRSVEVRLIMAMEEALQRKRLVDAGERVSRDSVEWWRCHDDENAKVVVHPVEKCRDKLLPYPYPCPAERPAPSRAGDTASSTKGEWVVSSESICRRALTCITRTLLWLLLLFLVFVNVLALGIIVYIVIEWKE